MQKVKPIAGWLALLLIMSVCLQNHIFAKDSTTLIFGAERSRSAQEKVIMEDWIISSTFKSLAKAFVALTDINKLKTENIDKINKMDTEKFKKRYAQVYAVIKDLPSQLQVSYGFHEQMTKEQVVKNIKSLDKKKIYGLIDSLPDRVIAHHFKQYLNQSKEELKNSSVIEQINKLWNKMIGKVRKE